MAFATSGRSRVMTTIVSSGSKWTGMATPPAVGESWFTSLVNRDSRVNGGRSGDHPQLPLVDLDRRPPKQPPFSARPPEPGPHALGDEAPLELRDRGHDREYRLPEGVVLISGRVYRACPYR